ncbi:MFS transporter [Herbaspirillum sp. C9C3]|uniref:MFS transporter n=1 Tax=Herbaspirillum sp. C9C3 TaxID=2735271 RepID=UPI001584DD81|nr:MFS transporter [uncultured Herbaspirillum sp.]NUT61867.1 MFS transporter [Herbaspirillum sp. C9C3]
MHTAVPLRGIDDVVAFIDSRSALSGHAGLVWWLLLGGLFLEALSHSALSVGLAPMIRQLGLGPSEVALLASSAAFSALLANPLGGWLADRWGRVRPLLAAKLLVLAAALLVAFGEEFGTLVTGRVIAGLAFGLDFAVAMAMLAELTPQRLRHRLNLWQALWYLAVCSNLLLTLAVEQWEVGDSLWRYPLAFTAAAALLLLNLQMLLLVESPCWLARRQRWQALSDTLERLYPGQSFQIPEALLHPPDAPGFGLAGMPRRSDPGLRSLLRRPYRARIMLAASVQIGQAVQYFAIGWYLPVLGMELFGEDFSQAALGVLIFNVCGLAGGLLAPALARRLGLRQAAAWGFAMCCLVLLVLAGSWRQLAGWQALLLPSLFLLCHAAGPGANGKSLSSLSFPSELRARANGVMGSLGGASATLALFLFPLLQSALGTAACLLLVAALALLAALACCLIRWDPQRSGFHPDLEAMTTPDVAMTPPARTDRRRHERP